MAFKILLKKDFPSRLPSWSCPDVPHKATLFTGEVVWEIYYAAGRRNNFLDLPRLSLKHFRFSFFRQSSCVQFIWRLKNDQSYLFVFCLLFKRIERRFMKTAGKVDKKLQTMLEAVETIPTQLLFAGLTSWSNPNWMLLSKLMLHFKCDKKLIGSKMEKKILHCLTTSWNTFSWTSWIKSKMKGSVWEANCSETDFNSCFWKNGELGQLKV